MYLLSPDHRTSFPKRGEDQAALPDRACDELGWSSLFVVATPKAPEPPRFGQVTRVEHGCLGVSGYQVKFGPGHEEAFTTTQVVPVEVYLHTLRAGDPSRLTVR